MSQPDIVALSTAIARNTIIIAVYLQQNNLPFPSFDLDGPSRSQIPADAPEIEAARMAVIEATQQLRRLILGPLDYLTTFTRDELLSRQASDRLKIATSFPPGEETTFTEIAESCNIPVQDVKSIVRHATRKCIFEEPQPGIVTHNAVSRLLAENQTLTYWVEESTHDLQSTAAQTENAMVRYTGSQKPKETGFTLANKTNRPIYQEFEQHPERAQRFRSAMTLFTEGEAMSSRHVINGYAWKEIAGGIVVDVGGSHGTMCKAIASEHPSIRFIVQDLESVICSAPPLDEGQATRISYQAHDFFTPQPVKDADLYFLSCIFHNWNDEHSLQILRNLIPALKPGARIVINDNIVPSLGVLTKWHEERLRSMDLTTKEIQNSQERELDEWKSLFERADPRFRFKGATQPEGSALWLLEAVWTP